MHMRKMLAMLILVMLLLAGSTEAAQPKIPLNYMNWSNDLTGIIFSGTVPSGTTNTLYSSSGTLYWGTTVIGNVVGPASATSGNFPTFSGTTGKIIANSAYGPSSFATASHNQAASTITSGTFDTARIPDLSATYVPKSLLTEQGDLAYRDGSGWTYLHHGTTDQYLKTGGHGANPSWDTPASSDSPVFAVTATTGADLASFISSNGAGTYYLTEDISITAVCPITTNNITIDGNGHSFKVKISSGYALDIQSNNFEMRNYVIEQQNTAATTPYMIRMGQPTAMWIWGCHQKLRNGYIYPKKSNGILIDFIVTTVENTEITHTTGYGTGITVGNPTVEANHSVAAKFDTVTVNGADLGVYIPNGEGVYAYSLETGGCNSGLKIATAFSSQSCSNNFFVSCVFDNQQTGYAVNLDGRSDNPIYRTMFTECSIYIPGTNSAIGFVTDEYVQYLTWTNGYMYTDGDYAAYIQGDYAVISNALIRHGKTNMPALLFGSGATHNIVEGNIIINDPAYYGIYFSAGANNNTATSNQMTAGYGVYDVGSGNIKANNYPT